MRSVLAPLAAAVVLALAASASAADPVSEETVAFFRQNCASCHTIGGGPLTGPDLRDVTKRRDREQLVRFVLDPKAAIDSGDEYLKKLFNAARGVYMPTVPGLPRDRVAKLLELVEQESALEKSQFQGLQISERPLTADDAERGRRLFLGTERLAAGAPACISCHAVRGAPGFGGGRLGPDLTAAYARLEGRKGLAAWLSSPPLPTMAPVFRAAPLEGEEILALVAYLKDRAETGAGAPDGSGTFEYLVSGVAGLVATLLLFDFLWRNRYRGVRRTMVERAMGHGAMR